MTCLHRAVDNGNLGILKLLLESKQCNLNVVDKNVKKVLLSTPVYTLHKPKRQKFKRVKVMVSNIDEQWQVDLIDLKAIKGSNNGFTFVFTCIDVFSKFAWAESIKNKEAKSCKEALENIIKTSKRKATYIYLGIQLFLTYLEQLIKTIFLKIMEKNLWLFLKNFVTKMISKFFLQNLLLRLPSLNVLIGL